MEWIVIGGLCIAPIVLLVQAGGPDAMCQEPRKIGENMNSRRSDPLASEFGGAYGTTSAPVFVSDESVQV